MLLEWLTRPAENSPTYDALKTQLAAKDAEIARLKGEAQSWRDQSMRDLAAVAERDAELKTLKEQLEWQAAMTKALSEAQDRYVPKLAEQDAELKRLNALLDRGVEVMEMLTLRDEADHREPCLVHGCKESLAWIEELRAARDGGKAGT